MPGIGNLDKGTLTGRETFAYYDSVLGSYSDPPTEDAAWVEMERIRNVQIEDGPELTDVNFHGAERNGASPGYSANSGSFEYVKRRGTDPVFEYLKAKQAAAEPVMFRFLDAAITVDGAKGHDAPYYLGRFSETRNGASEVVISIPFSFADVYDYQGNRVEKADVTIVIP